MEKPKRPKRLSRTTIYESEWINVYTDKVEYPAGRIINGVHVLEYPREAVGAIVLNDTGDILLEYAYRYHSGNDGWEIPAGGIEEGESIIFAGAREIKEETGYDTKNHQLLYTYNPSNGSSNQVFHIIRCFVKGEAAEFDRNEVGELKWFTFAEIQKMIQEKTIADGLSLTALLLYGNK